MSASYFTAAGESENIIEIKRSRFITTVAHVADGDAADAFVKSVKRRYPDATHNCYAYISDISGNAARFSDDGEPSGTAGQPMLEVLKKRGLRMTAAVVTRYFGGIKLGAGGLVGAYTQSVSEALDHASVVKMTECEQVRVETDYSSYSVIDKLLARRKIKRGDTVYGDRVSAVLLLKDAEAEAILSEISELSAGGAVIERAGRVYAQED